MDLNTRCAHGKRLLDEQCQLCELVWHRSATYHEPRQQALAERKAEVAAGDLRWYYLSFATEDEFLGALQVQAYGRSDALLRSHEMHLNPGGSVAIIQGPAGFVPPAWSRNRLLSREDLNRLDAELAPNEPDLTEETGRGIHRQPQHGPTRLSSPPRKRRS